MLINDDCLVEGDESNAELNKLGEKYPKSHMIQKLSLMRFSGINFGLLPSVRV